MGGSLASARYGSGEAERPEAILALIRKGAYREAFPLLKELADREPQSTWGKRALYLLGYTTYQLRELPQALGYYQQARKEYGQLGDYVEWQIARIYIAQGEHLKALETLKGLPEAYPWSLWLPWAQLYSAEELAALGRHPEAAEVLREFMRQHGRGPWASRALLDWARSLEAQGKTAEAWGLYQRLYTSHPASSESEAAWERMLALDPYKALTLPEHDLPAFQSRARQLTQEGRHRQALEAYQAILFWDPQSPEAEEARLQAALIYHGMRNRLRATRLLEQFAHHYPQSRHLPEALYSLGKTYWNTQQNDRGREPLQRLTSQFPDSPWAEKGLYVQGRMAEEEKELPQARKLYGQLLEAFPGGEMVSEAQWRLGWIQYQEGDPLQAAIQFRELSLRAGAQKWQEQALYWQGRALEKAQKADQAAPLFRSLTEEHGPSYYGVLGWQRWQGLVPPETLPEKPHPGPLVLPPDGLFSAERTPTLGEKPLFHLVRARELGEMGLVRDSQKEIAALAALLPPQKDSSFYVGKLYFQNGLYLKAIQTFNTLFQGLSPQERRALSLDFWRLLYPRRYWDSVQLHARQTQQSPFLLLALIRQESAFESTAVSSAGACGLMQLLPSTGEAVFRQTQQGEFQQDLLFHPEVNISLGARYLAQLLDRFEGDLHLALAGYNAGPARVQEWLRRHPGVDPEEFIETIPYEETRQYVKNILRNIFIYQKIYPQGTGIGDREQGTKEGMER
ncbi:MAG: transglycosylase SLT domain-containing protein [Candidatus Tectomicrobia bacterium]|uniref:Transglycosylase SLT domain-containing protein n=1 Tax=Tectimicrobiota bacterium TaxID=2528274 RepID=A0A932CQ70_UNCTE|nr:transglycosylase SLT domain-containing protein [Candidatus Tectomicrobia bacterium]